MKRENILLYLSIIGVLSFIMFLFAKPPLGHDRGFNSDSTDVIAGKLVKAAKNEYDDLYFIGDVPMISEKGKVTSTGYHLYQIKGLYSNKDGLYYKLSNGDYVDEHDVNISYLYKYKKEAIYKIPFTIQQDRVMRLQSRVHDIIMYSLLVVTILLITLYQTWRLYKVQKKVK